MSIKGTKRDLFAVTQKAVIFDSDTHKFLLLNIAANQGGIDVLGNWDLPGGHIDHSDGELLSALEREVIEELGSQIELQYNGVISHDRCDYDEQERIRITYLFTRIKGEIILNDESSGYVWQNFTQIQDSSQYYPWLKELILKAYKSIEQTN